MASFAKLSVILALHENVSMELYVKKSTRLILNVYVVRVIMDLFAKTTSMNAKISMLVQRIAFVEIALALMNVYVFLVILVPDAIKK